MLHKYICHATYVLLLGLLLNDNDACMMMNIVADEYACCCPCQTINSAQNFSHNAMLLLLFVLVETACWDSCYAVVWFSWVMFCLMLGWNHVCGLHKMPCCVKPTLHQIFPWSCLCIAEWCAVVGLLAMRTWYQGLAVVIACPNFMWWCCWTLLAITCCPCAIVGFYCNCLMMSALLYWTKHHVQKIQCEICYVLLYAVVHVLCYNDDDMMLTVLLC